MKKFEDKPIPLIFRNEDKSNNAFTQNMKSILKLYSSSSRSKEKSQWFLLLECIEQESLTFSTRFYSNKKQALQLVRLPTQKLKASGFGENPFACLMKKIKSSMSAYLTPKGWDLSKKTSITIFACSVSLFCSVQCLSTILWDPLMNMPSIVSVLSWDCVKGWGLKTTTIFLIFSGSWEIFPLL